MEKNTVLLSVEIYNELRDFKKKIEAGESYYVYTSGYVGGYGNCIQDNF